MPAFPMPINPLAPVLEKRRIPADQGIGLGLSFVPTRELQDLFGTAIPPQVTATRLPYFDLDGTELIGKDGEQFTRYRLDPPDGSRLPNGVGKYRQKRGTGLAVYLPRMATLNWVEIAHNPEEPIWITEGEFKAIRVCQMGVPCVGLGGVDNWREKSGEIAAPLNFFKWLNRSVYIVYDADKESTEENPYKPEVTAAAKRLAARLFEEGAQVYLLSIVRTSAFRKARALDVQVKQGIDDWIDAGGDIDELLGSADLAIEDAHMARLLREYAVYMGGKPHVVRLSDGTPFKRGEFTEVIEASAIRRMPRPKGGYTEVRVAEEWIKSPNRYEIDRYVFKPNDEGGYSAQSREYNIWGGFPTWEPVGESDEDKEQYSRVVDVWRRFIGRLFGEHTDYFEQWVAHMLQRPGEKTTIAVILASVLNGVGKSLLGEIIRGLVGRDGSVAVELDRLKSNFNKVLERKLFIQMDEAEGTFSGLESKLKDLISADTVVVEPKGFDAYVVDNYARLYLTSNSTRPIRLDSENRRMLVIVPDLTVADAKGEWGIWVRDVAAKLLKSELGMRCLSHRLRRVDLTGWNPCARVPVTAAMLDMIESGRTKSSSVVDGLFEALSEDEGWGWVITGELTRQDAKVWGDLVGLVKANGGQVLAHAYRYKDKLVKCRVLDPAGKLPRKMPSGEDKWFLDATAAGISGTDCVAAAARALKAWGEWSGVVRSDKF